MMMDGMTSPRLAKTAPQKPPCVKPTQVAELIPIGPGVTCAIETRLPKASMEMIPLRFTNSAISRGTRTYPPPKLTSPN